MRHAISYQHCVEPDYETMHNRMVIAIAEWIHDGMDADDVRIDAARIAYNVNKRFPLCVTAEDVRELADLSVYYSVHDSLP